MRDDEKSREELLEELASLRERLAEAESLEGRHKRTKEKLFRLKRAFETMQIGLTITDTQGVILYSNPAEAMMHGYEVKELIGQDVRILAPRSLWKPMKLDQIKTMKRWKRKSFNSRSMHFARQEN